MKRDIILGLLLVEALLIIFAFIYIISIVFGNKSIDFDPISIFCCIMLFFNVCITIAIAREMKWALFIK